MSPELQPLGNRTSTVHIEDGSSEYDVAHVCSNIGLSEKNRI